MERRDLYDENRNLTGETILKGEEIPKGRYIVVVLVFIQNSKGEFLIQKRSKIKNKIMPNILINAQNFLFFYFSSRKKV